MAHEPKVFSKILYRRTDRIMLIACLLDFVVLKPSFTMRTLRKSLLKYSEWSRNVTYFKPKLLYVTGASRWYYDHLSLRTVVKGPSEVGHPKSHALLIMRDVEHLDHEECSGAQPGSLSFSLSIFYCQFQDYKFWCMCWSLLVR